MPATAETISLGFPVAIDRIDRELKNERSAKEISVELAEQSGWNKKEIYTLINQKKK